MHVIMVKKRLANGDACRKCAQAEDFLRSRGLWNRIDEVVLALEDDPNSPGMQLGARFGVEVAPFFIVRRSDGTEVVYESVLKLIKECLSEPGRPEVTPGDEQPTSTWKKLRPSSPTDRRKPFCDGGSSTSASSSPSRSAAPKTSCSSTWRARLDFRSPSSPSTPDGSTRRRIGSSTQSESDTASRLRSPRPTPRRSSRSFARKGSSVSTTTVTRNAAASARSSRCDACSRAFVRGLPDSAGIRARRHAPASPSSSAIEPSPGSDGPLVKLNPLAAWTSAQTWQFIRDNGVPFNSLHERGFVSIGCEPCTRATLPGEHERAGRWWWEDSTKRECGLHIGNTKPPR